MNPKELRPGNIVQSNYKTVEKSRYKDDIFIVDKNFFYNDLAEKCSGIPLTEEWDGKFKFKKTGYRLHL